MGDAAIFFNAQRVGSGSDSDKRKGIAAIALYAATHLQKRMSVKAVFLSEVTSDFNVTERLTLQAQQKVSKQSTKKSSAQLGYAAFCGRKVLALSYHTPADRPFDASVKKGLKKQWTQISKRKAVFVQDVKVGGAPVVVYHANSSAFGQWLVAWLTLDLDNRCAGNFILMGDFNTEPANLRKAFNVVHIGTNTKIIAPTKATHRGGKVLDYIVVGRNVSKKVDVAGFSSPSLNSDHCPIVVYEVDSLTQPVSSRPQLALGQRAGQTSLRLETLGGVVETQLRHSCPAEVQGKAPARAPPYFASKLVRRHFGQPEPQLAMFH